MATLTKQLILILVLVVGLPAFVGFSAQPAAAASDPVVFDQLQTRRRALLTRESNLMRDQDDLFKRMEDLKRRQDADAANQLNEVCRRVDTKSWELRQVRQDIREVDTRLL